MKKYWSPDIETMEQGQIRVMQEAKLQNQIKYVYDYSPFYRSLLDKNGIRPEHIKTLEDLDLIPLTGKDDLRKSQEEYPPFGNYLAVDRERIVRINTTSGTTGKPSYLAFTKRDVETRAEGCTRVMWAMGLRESDVYFNALQLAWFSGGQTMKDVAKKVGAAYVAAGTGNSERLINTALDLKPTFMSLTASYAVYLAQVCEKMGVDPKDIGVKTMASAAEPGLPALRKDIERVWDVKAYNHGGLSDVFSLIWVECEEQDAMHVMNPDLVLLQVIDLRTGKSLPLEEGVEGIACYTNLDKEAQPVIRFNSNDVIRVLQTAPCACGRTGIKLEIIDRVDNMLIIKGLNVFPTAVQQVVASFNPLTTGTMQIIKQGAGPLVEGPLVIEVEYTKDLSAEKLDELRKNIITRIHSQLMFRAEVKLVPMGTIPRSEFKNSLVKRVG